MLEVGWHRSALAAGRRWMVVRGGPVSGALAGAASSNATCSPSWIISGLAVVEQPLSAATPGGEGAR